MEHAPWYARDAEGRSQCWDAWDELVGGVQKCLIPLIAYSIPLTFSCLLGKTHFLSLPEQPATSPRTCWCARDAAHPRQFQLVKVHQAGLLPGYLGVVFFSFSFTLGHSTSSADGIFIMFFVKSIWPTRESISLILKHDHLFRF